MLPAAAWEAQMYIQTLTLGSMSLVFMHFFNNKTCPVSESQPLTCGRVCDDAHLMGGSIVNLTAPAENHHQAQLSYFLEAENMFGLCKWQLPCIAPTLRL